MTQLVRAPATEQVLRVRFVDDWQLNLRPVRRHRRNDQSQESTSQIPAEADQKAPPHHSDLERVRKAVAGLDAHLMQIDARLGRIEKALDALADGPSARGVSVVRALPSTPRTSDLRGERRPRRLRATEPERLAEDHHPTGGTAQA
jgi:hypothetical protein